MVYNTTTTIRMISDLLDFGIDHLMESTIFVPVKWLLDEPAAY